tara:strand:+ start:28980 stop:29201 length:222 start_codon:yes stop_codon:yes gene_type:complete
MASQKNEQKYETVFEVWVQGNLGIHAGKPLLHSIHHDEPEAQWEMKQMLEAGKFAAIKQVRRPSGPSRNDSMK